MLYHEHDEDPELRPGPITREQREEIVVQMAAGIVRAYRYFRPHLQAGTRTGNVEATPDPDKIGRNDLCPCGSGRKYKRCCGGVTINLPRIFVGADSRLCSDDEILCGLSNSAHVSFAEPHDPQLPQACEPIARFLYRRDTRFAAVPGPLMVGRPSCPLRGCALLQAAGRLPPV